jgi:hypothetical protein
VCTIFFTFNVISTYLPLSASFLPTHRTQYLNIQCMYLPLSSSFTACSTSTSNPHASLAYLARFDSLPFQDGLQEAADLPRSRKCSKVDEFPSPDGLTRRERPSYLNIHNVELSFPVGFPSLVCSARSSFRSTVEERQSTLDGFGWTSVESQGWSTYS